MDVRSNPNHLLLDMVGRVAASLRGSGSVPRKCRGSYSMQGRKAFPELWCVAEFLRWPEIGEIPMKHIISALHHIFDDEAGNFQKKVVGLYILLVAFNIATWIWAIVALAGNAVLLGAAGLAYTFGLRHAFDADHIASIDTVTRKLMQQNRRPATVGFHFAIGHSLAVLAFVIAIAALAAWSAASEKFSFMAGAGVASTFFSASFLLAMAMLNLMIARSTYLAFRQVRNGGAYAAEDFDLLLNKRGFLSRIFRPLFRLVDKSWHMIFIGFLFGLGFDTATEVSLLGIAGVEAAKGLSVWTILVFPALFAAGMSLMDTTDGILMVRTYGWAFRNPIRKLYYNLSITIVSAVIALLIAGIEILALISEQFSLKGHLWNQVNSLSEHWELIGILVVSIFVASWFISTLVYRFAGYDKMDSAVVP
ncbi:nickel/cobalt efflux system [Sulfuriferula plumbiphila]|uniref:Nickel/cobalt efflux system n=1 Tax=Sulfuriferula plumbiphila TaxID=171865 RepID=A0A512L9S7_9PROT|nr:HoxN/HupN/NixA family nickel/cobalt transporter [Sulfuriferula plumbiphila]BBP03731.1 nickel/cobalt efflux system [Sulfuriferula plumbiphila]GEP31240.1 nickel/cobalt efflux system [Sulfuriferula plumbiphila]